MNGANIEKKKSTDCHRQKRSAVEIDFLWYRSLRTIDYVATIFTCLTQCEQTLSLYKGDYEFGKN